MHSCKGLPFGFHCGEPPMRGDIMRLFDVVITDPGFLSAGITGAFTAGVDVANALLDV